MFCKKTGIKFLWNIESGFIVTLWQTEKNYGKDSFKMKEKSTIKEDTTARQYATQMEAAKKGILTKELEAVAEKESMTPEELMPLVAAGKVVICANKNHKCIDPQGVGSMLKTKINVNLGVSRDCKDYDIEMKKVMAAVDMGAHAIMDLSSHGDTIPFRRKLTSECPAMIGTVPVYDSVIHYQRDLDTLTARDFLDVVRLHAEDGVDFVTLHCGITRKTIEQIKNHKRKMNIVSRGGSLVFAWMCMTGNENPAWRIDKACMGKGCSGNGRGTRTYVHGPDCRKYENSADNLRRGTVLCTGAVGYRYCAGL